MTGQEHTAEAERLLTDMPTVADWDDHPGWAEEHVRAAFAQAQVHATLAVAAEQRTANLIAWYALADAAGDMPDEAADLARQVNSRLGLTDGAA